MLADYWELPSEICCCKSGTRGIRARVGPTTKPVHRYRMTMNGILLLCCSPQPLLSFHRYHNPTPVSLAFSLSFAIPSKTSRFRCGSGCGPKRRSRVVPVRASRRESPYEVLGVPPSATPRDVKRAYRKLALQFHPDVNKEPNAQERFMRIKHAYNTLINSESRFNNATSTRANYSTPYDKKSTAQEEQFYGFVDFLKDLQEEFQNWEADLNREEKPKSLWEELAEIGEEFVEFLEKELNIRETNFEDDSTGSQRERRQEEDVQRQPNVEESIDEVEAALVKLKKELGL